MEATTILSHSKTVPFGFSVVSNKLSLRPFNKYFYARAHSNSFQCHSKQPNHSCFPLKCTSNSNPFSSLPKPTRRTNLLPSPKCSVSSKTNSDSENPILKYSTNLSFDSIKATLLQLTPLDIVKWSGILSIIIAASKWTLNTVFNPFFWMYFSWTWLFWPWMVALVIGVYGLYSFRKHLLGEANIFEQLAIVTSVFTWLTLVPPGVMVGHWLAAFEGPELHCIPGGWNNLGIWILILVTLLMQYNATLYLAKYSEKVVVPTAVVQFGPYRWVRHPIYASTMLLFATYCLALRAPLSLLFVVAVSSLYYRQKAEQEEALMVEAFGESYTEYASKVRYRLIPFVY
ncbi:putative phospholipid methyltransferase [Senna tora]|uniref:Protein-S-isoprenylcysteine O-methyltransferase n=1 Tax=Senna tora TaxID=362788 RepID=A0A835CC57_9FABA|nr:putative phospholipid methyltransferase [Senna tora]